MSRDVAVSESVAGWVIVGSERYHASCLAPDPNKVCPICNGMFGYEEGCWLCATAREEETIDV